MPKSPTFVLKEIVKDRLYSIAIGSESDAFKNCFDNWRDIGYLYEVFLRNPEVLKFHNLSIKEAVEKLVIEADKFEEDILMCAEEKTEENILDEYIFEPLHKSDDYELPLIQAKAYGTTTGKSFLRLYAIRLADGCYIITGGIIKTADTIQKSEGGEEELNTLKAVEKQLRTNNSFDSFDIGTLIVE